jgi:hypothetical protein
VIAAGPSPQKALFFTLYIVPKMEFANAYFNNFVFLIISSMLKWKRCNFHVLFCSYISDIFIAFHYYRVPVHITFSSSFFIKSGVRLHYN